MNKVRSNINSKKNILFIFHETNRTGATLVLLNYVKALYIQNKYNLFFYVIKPGPLEVELNIFGKVIRDSSFNDFPKRNLFARMFSRILGKPIANKLIVEIEKSNINFIVANTLVCATVISKIKKFITVPVAWYIHELGLAASLFRFDQQKIIPLIDFWIVNSDSTLEYILSTFHVNTKKCFVQPPSLNLVKIGNNLLNKEKKDEFVIGSSGSVISRKGYELFILVALALKKMNPSYKYKFVWVGNCTAVKNEISHDLTNCGLSDYVEFVGEKENPYEYYADFDIFISTSKEESFGLACLECAAMGKPVIGFRGTGGLEEVIINCGGELIEYLDTHQMAERIMALAHNQEKMGEMKKKSQEYALQFNSDQLNIKWCNLIDQLIY